MKTDGTLWMQAMISKAPKLNDKDLKQEGAKPLSAFLRFDPWTDQVVQLAAAPATDTTLPAGGGASTPTAAAPGTAPAGPTQQ